MSNGIDSKGGKNSSVPGFEHKNLTVHLAWTVLDL